MKYKSKKKSKNKGRQMLDENGNWVDIPVEGSLGLLASGYKGLMAWREKKKQFIESQILNETKGGGQKKK
jgi:hypothetical protein